MTILHKYEMSISLLMQISKKGTASYMGIKKVHLPVEETQAHLRRSLLDLPWLHLI